VGSPYDFDFTTLHKGEEQPNEGPSATVDGKTVRVQMFSREGQRIGLPHTKDEWIDYLMKINLAFGFVLILYAGWQNMWLLAGVVMAAVGLGLLFSRPRAARS